MPAPPGVAVLGVRGVVGSRGGWDIMIDGGGDDDDDDDEEERMENGEWRERRGLMLTLLTSLTRVPIIFQLAGSRHAGSLHIMHLYTRYVRGIARKVCLFDLSQYA